MLVFSFCYKIDSKSCDNGEHLFVRFCQYVNDNDI